MDEVQIVTYSAENHSAVRRLFSDGMLEHRKAAVFAGLSSTKLQALLLFVFLLGYFCHSTWLGIGSMFIVMVLQAYMVYWWFNTYVRYVHLFCTIMKDIFEIIYLKHNYRYALDTDLEDEELRFWTTKPNVFLVAKIRDRVVGCIAYKKIAEDTVEMNRTSVDKDFRGLKIGQKLVNELLHYAKSEGYRKMYLTTGNPMTAPIKLYEKMGFRFVENLGMPFDNYLIDIITGIYQVAYIKEL